MSERPILMSAPMVRALLAGTKTQTRRAIAFPRKRDAFVIQEDDHGLWPYQSDDGESTVCDDGCEHPYTCPYGVPGDRLWVREAWHTDTSDLAYARAQHEDVMSSSPICYRADPVHHNAGCTWRPSIHMPRWASRITLEVTAVRVERLQDISEADAKAEGIAATPWAEFPPIEAYKLLWNAINAEKAPWDSSPWVWVIEFRRLT